MEQAGKGIFNLRTFLQQAVEMHFRVQTLLRVNCIEILARLLQHEIHHVRRGPLQTRDE